MCELSIGQCVLRSLMSNQIRARILRYLLGTMFSNWRIQAGFEPPVSFEATSPITIGLSGAMRSTRL